jgi:parvulin-like peptidyl-prolyl isomerase
MKRGMMAVALMILCLTTLLVGCDSNKADKAIAEVNGEKITQADFNALNAVLIADYENANGVTLDKKKDKTVIDQIKTNTYDNLVLQKIIRQDAEKQGIKVNTDEVDEYVAYIKESNNATDKEGYKTFLEKTKFTDKGLREYLETQQLNSNLAEKVTADVKVTDAEAQTFYNEHKDEFKDPGGIQIYHIFVEDEKTAQDIIEKLNSGGDFAALAKEYSIDTSNKDLGGDLGIINEDTNFVTEFKTAALALQPGEYTKQPVKSDYGYHIIKAGETKAAYQKTFDESKEEIISQLTNDKKTTEYNAYIEKLKKNADIKDLR